MLLAIETSGRGAQLALATPQGPLGRAELAPGESTAAGLIPRIDRLCAAAGRSARDLQALAVSIGPGSFTGLRVGVTTAKTLAYATGAALIGIDTLQVIAEQTQPATLSVWTLLDAQRGQLYAAAWRRASPGEWTCQRPAAILDVDALLADLPTGAALAGPGCALLVGRMPSHVTLLPAECWTPRAETVARIGQRKWAAGEVDDPWRLAPRYLRRAAAEEKAASRRHGSG